MGGLEALLQGLPPYAEDLKLNIAAALRQTQLTLSQTWGTVIASSMASRSGVLIAAAFEEAAKTMLPAEMNGAKTAAAIMGMNNIFFRFRHLVENPQYESLPAGIRMNGMRTHGADPLDFELWCLATSTIHGCGPCMAAHEKALRARGVGEETIEAAVRIAAVVHAIAVVLDTESAGLV